MGNLRVGDYVVWEYEGRQWHATKREILVSKVVGLESGPGYDCRIEKTKGRSRVGGLYFSSESRVRCEEVVAAYEKREMVYDAIWRLFDQQRLTSLLAWRIPGMEAGDGAGVNSGTLVYGHVPRTWGLKGLHPEPFFSVAHFDRKTRYRLLVEKNHWSQRVTVSDRDVCFFSPSKLDLGEVMSALQVQEERYRNAIQMFSSLEERFRKQCRLELSCILRGRNVDWLEEMEEPPLDLLKLSVFLNGQYMLDESLPDALELCQVDSKREESKVKWP